MPYKITNVKHGVSVGLQAQLKAADVLEIVVPKNDDQTWVFENRPGPKDKVLKIEEHITITDKEKTQVYGTTDDTRPEQGWLFNPDSDNTSIETSDSPKVVWYLDSPNKGTKVDLKEDTGNLDDGARWTFDPVEEA